MKSKINYLLVLMLFALILLQGCTAKNEGEQTSLVTDTASNNSVTVVDYLGRTVTITQPVERIACGYAYTGHVATLLGKGEDIVAVVDGLKRDKVLTEMHPHIKELPVPFGTGTINIEELLSCDPDVIFLKLDTATNKSVTEKLDKLHLPYIVIDYATLEEQLETFTIMGKVLREEEKAQEYINYYKKVINDTKKISDTIPEESKSRLYHSVNEAVRTDLNGSFTAQWIEITGAINVSVNDELKVSGDKSFATLEQIYLWDPDLIIANEAGVPEYILGNEQWASLRAVKSNHVYQIPNGISRWGHPGSLETPLAIMWTSKLLYPEYFEHINMEQETKKYYSDFFEIELSDEQVEKILSGHGMRELRNK